MRKCFFLFFILTILSFGILGAQEIQSITKTEVLTKAIEQNNTLKISEQEFLKSRADYRQTNSVFLPNINASHSGIATTNPLMAFGAKLNQEILTVGDFSPDILNNPQRVTSFATKFEVQQPIINLDGYYQRKAAKNKMEAVELQNLRIKDYLTFEVEKAYMQLQLAYKSLEVINQSYNYTLENKKVAEDNLKQGYLQRADLLSVEVRVNDLKNQLQTAKSTISNASDYLLFLMNENSGGTLKPSDSLTIISISKALGSSVSKERTDIKAMHLTTDAYESIYKSDKVTFIPRLTAFGSYEFYDNKILSGSANGYLVGAALNWNIFEGYKKFGKAQKSKANYHQAEIEYEQYISQSNLDIKKANRMLIDADNRLKLTQLIVEQSEESLRIRKNRYREGLEKTTDLLFAESQYAQKQLQYYKTIFEYNHAYLYLQFLTKE
jgi:outer membrane protein TolC